MSIVLDVEALARDTVNPYAISHAGPGKENYWEFDLDGPSDGDGLHWNSKLARAIAVARLPLLFPGVTLNLRTADLEFLATDPPAGWVVPPATPWEPDNAGITGATLRLINDPANACSDTAGAVPATDGQLVGSVVDSARSALLTEATSGFRPTLRADALGGRPMLEYDGIGTRLNATAALLPHIQGDRKEHMAFFPLLREETSPSVVRTLLAAAKSDAAGNVPVECWWLFHDGPEHFKCGDSPPAKPSIGTANTVLSDFVVVIYEARRVVTLTAPFYALQSNMWVWKDGEETPVALGDDLDAGVMNTVDQVFFGLLQRAGAGVLPYKGKMGRVPFYSGVMPADGNQRRNVALGLQEHYGQ